MSTDVSDFKVASLAAGFTLGFGFFTVWNAIKQTKSIQYPWRSVYAYMVWGELAANLLLAIVAWLFLDGSLQANVPTLVVILILWVVQLQLLMQIIINRIAVVIDNKKMITKLKWGTAFLVTCINISVFCIWIPAHISPPPFPILVTVNRYWDRVEKVIIFIVDAGLNYYFLTIVRRRLVEYHGLKKYEVLIRFNARIMVVSLALDIILICLMQLQNEIVYVQFHPLVYMVKLNIELSMADLIKKIAKASINSSSHEFELKSNSHNPSSQNAIQIEVPQSAYGVNTTVSGIGHSRGNANLEHNGIMMVKEVDLVVESVRDDGEKSLAEDGCENGFDFRKHGLVRDEASKSEDELPLAPSNAVQSRKEGW